MQDSDGALWQLTRKGDPEAFGELFRRHHRAIYNYCFRRIGDWSSAEDLVSIVFLEVWRKRNTELLPGKVLPWFYGVATNVLRNRRRAERRYADALRCLPVTDAVPDFVDDAAQRLDDQRLARELLIRLSQLPRRDQDVLTLCGWSGLTYDETAFASAFLLAPSGRGSHAPAGDLGNSKRGTDIVEIHETPPRRRSIHDP